MEIMQIAHVNDEGQPLCNQDGSYFHLCEPDEFERLPKDYRCHRCEQLFRHCFNLSNNKQQLLTEISRRTHERDSWCPVKDLCKIKTEVVMISISRSLRLLEVEGLVEMKANRNESFVRLCDKGNSANAYLLDVFQISE